MASARKGGPTNLIIEMAIRVPEKVKSICRGNLPFLLFLLIAIRCLTASSAPHSIYVFLFILIWVNMRLPNWMKSMLTEFGNRSMVMWFVHPPIGMYLFADYFNWLRNPLLVFLAVIFVCWIVSIAIDFICDRLRASVCLINRKAFKII